MKRSLIVAAIAFATLAGTARAQQPIQFGVAGGVSLPTSDLSDQVKAGFNLAGSITLKSPALPFGVRIEGAWDQFDLKGSTDGNFRVLSLTGNGVLEFPSSTPVKLYGIGGVGVYNGRTSVDVSGGTLTSNSENKFGFNLGGGVRMPLGTLDTYIEARYHRITDVDLSYIPVTFGIRF